MAAKKTSQKDSSRKTAIHKQIQVALDDVCAKALDEEYQKISQRMLNDLMGIPKGQQLLMHGKPEGWTGGILMVIGRINFLGDPSFEPYLTQEDLAKACGISVSTLSKRTKEISRILNLDKTADNYLASRMQNFYSEMYNSFEQAFLNDPTSITEALEQQGIPVSEEMSDLVKFLEKLKREHGPDAQITVVGDVIMLNGQPVLSLKPGQVLPENEIEDQIYELTIELLDMEPPVCRRIQTPDMPLDILHVAIQILMNWENSHLHQFEFSGQWIPNQMMGDNNFGYSETDLPDESDVYLGDLVSMWNKKRKKTTFHYTYDFGDNWEVEIVIQKVLPQTDPALNHPVCLEVEGIAPPEDCGGVPGYVELQEILADRTHPDHKEYSRDYRDWIKIGKKQNPKEINKNLLSLRRVTDE